MQRRLAIAVLSSWLCSQGCLLEIPEPPARSSTLCGCDGRTSCEGVWLSPEELSQLPIAGEPGCDSRCGFAWNALEQAARVEPVPVPDLLNTHDPGSSAVLAAALVGVRLDDAALRVRARDLIGLAIVAPPTSAEVFPLAAHLPMYVIAADLIDLGELDPVLDGEFRSFLSALLVHDFNGRTLLTAAGESPSHHGTNAAAAFAAIQLYLGNVEQLSLVESVLRGWLGDRDAHAAFEFGASAASWAADPAAPVPVNPKGATRDGHDLDGVLIDAMPGEFAWPPSYDIATYNALGGALVTAVILARKARHPWPWSDAALLRAARWLTAQGFDASGGESDKAYTLDLIDWAYASDLSPAPPSPPGRSMAWTSWTHQGRCSSQNRAP